MHDYPAHPPRCTRRQSIAAGAIGLLGLDVGTLALLRAAEGAEPPPARSHSVIFVFLSGGLSQLDSFDPKPEAPEEIRGEFGVVQTQTPGLFVCEHLPKLAATSQIWSVVRSLGHPSNDHSAGHHIMLTGRSDLPKGFDPNTPRPSDHPSLAAVAGAAVRARNNLPPAVVLPERLVHHSGRVIPGQFAGELGAARDPWFLEISSFEPRAYGAFPLFEFDHQQRSYEPLRHAFAPTGLSLPEGLGEGRLADRVRLLEVLDERRGALDAAVASGRLVGERAKALGLLTDPKVGAAFDVAASRALERYGDHSFGWSLLMARRLVEAGVRLVQVNLGNNETWDTHGNAFPHLKEKLLPPFDQSLAALLEDLAETGFLETTLVVVAGEFGRTPRISHLPDAYKLPGRDHWGAVQSVLIAGGGCAGGRIIGASDRIGAFPTSDPQTPENLAATIYTTLGIAPTDSVADPQGRPHFLYHGRPISGLYS